MRANLGLGREEIQRRKHRFTISAMERFDPAVEIQAFTANRVRTLGLSLRQLQYWTSRDSFPQG